MCLRRTGRLPKVGGRPLGRNRPFGEVHLLFGEVVKGRCGQAEVLGQECFGRMAHPVGDAERAELREVAVVKDQHEVARLAAQAFKHVAVAAWEVPYVARLEIVRFRVPARTDYRRPHPSFVHEGPLRRGGVPVQLAHAARLQPHRHARDSRGDGELLDGGLLGRALADHLSFGLLQSELKGWQLLAGDQGVGDVVHEAGVSSLRPPGAGQGRGHTSRKRRGARQKLSAMEVRHGISLLEHALRCKDCTPESAFVLASGEAVASYFGLSLPPQRNRCASTGENSLSHARRLDRLRGLNGSVGHGSIGHCGPEEGGTFLA